MTKYLQAKFKAMPKKILIIDDEINTRNALKRVLKEKIPEVEVLDSGESGDALKLAKTILPGLILLDVKMPGLNGLQVLKSLKKNENRHVRGIPVIMLTGIGNQEIMIQANKLGAEDYIVKPFDEKMFLLKIKKYLRI